MGAKPVFLTGAERGNLFKIMGRTDVNATTPTVSLQLDYLPPTADWSLPS